MKTGNEMVQSVVITTMCYKLCPPMPHVPLVFSHPGPFAAAHHRSPAIELDQTAVMPMAKVCGMGVIQLFSDSPVASPLTLCCSHSFAGEDVSIFPSFGAPKDKPRQDTLDFRLGINEFIGLTYSSMAGG